MALKNNAALATLLDASSLRIYYLLKKANRTCSVSNFNAGKHKMGEFHRMYEDLRNDSEKFKEYYRMHIKTFDYILEKIRHKLTKKWTNFNLQRSDGIGLYLTRRIPVIQDT